MGTVLGCLLPAAPQACSHTLVHLLHAHAHSGTHTLAQAAALGLESWLHLRKVVKPTKQALGTNYLD